MTLKQALIAAVSTSGLEDNLVEKILLDNGLNGSNLYTKENKTQIDICTMSVLFSVMQTQSISEGGFSVSTSFEATRLKILLLARANSNDPIAKEILSVYGDKNGVKSVSRW